MTMGCCCDHHTVKENCIAQLAMPSRLDVRMPVTYFDNGYQSNSSGRTEIIQDIYLL